MNLPRTTLADDLSLLTVTEKSMIVSGSSHLGITS